MEKVDGVTAPVICNNSTGMCLYLYEINPTKHYISLRCHCTAATNWDVHTLDSVLHIERKTLKSFNDQT